MTKKIQNPLKSVLNIEKASARYTIYKIAKYPGQYQLGLKKNKDFLLKQMPQSMVFLCSF